MINAYIFKRILLLAMVVLTPLSSLAQSPVEVPLPAHSIYHLQTLLEDQSEDSVGLDKYQGHLTIVSMFYASCPHVCPLIISTIKLTEGVLTETQQKSLRILMISIDPERDTPEVLLETMQRHAVDANRWSMTRPTAKDVRTISGVLGIKYKQLPNGEFNHSSKLILLDRQGVPIASTSQIGRLDEAFLEAIKTAENKH